MVLCRSGQAHNRLNVCKGKREKIDRFFFSLFLSFWFCFFRTMLLSLSLTVSVCLVSPSWRVAQTSLQSVSLCLVVSSLLIVSPQLSLSVLCLCYSFLSSLFFFFFFSSPFSLLPLLFSSSYTQRAVRIAQQFRRAAPTLFGSPSRHSLLRSYSHLKPKDIICKTRDTDIFEHDGLYRWRRSSLSVAVSV